MKVLILGSGAREHALATAMSQDPGVTSAWCAPGNPGTARIAGNRPVDLADPGSVVSLARDLGPDLVVIGPEAPVVAGMADTVREAGFVCFGPSREAARLEGSKAFAKEVMAVAGVPTAGSRLCRSKEEVGDALDTFGPPYVVKNDGLAAGKGVVVTDDRSTAEAHAAECGRVVVEEYLDGPEVSLFVLTDGFTEVPLLPAQDFKRVYDGDRGPNTGGMGAYCPLPWLPRHFAEDVLDRVARPTLDEMRRRDAPYSGVLYIGLTLTSNGPKVVEFNARFGDPEAQVILPLLRTPLAGLLEATAAGRLSGVDPLEWSDEAAVTVVIASEGYPASPSKGDLIDRVAEAEAVPGASVLHAGTRVDDGRLVSAGGRVLNVVGRGPSLTSARETAYEAAAKIRIRGSFYRRDIAERAAALAHG